MSQKFTHPQGCKMSSPTKSGSQPCGWQIASSRDSFCDFGRKLETLRMPVRNTVLCCHGRQHKSWCAREGTFRTYTSLRSQLKQAYLAFLIFAQRNQTCQRHPENCALHCPLIPKYHFAKLYQITLTNISISHILWKANYLTIKLFERQMITWIRK